MATYYLRTKKESGIAVLYCKVRKSNLAKTIELSTGIKVDVVQWGKAQKSAKGNEMYRRSEPGRKVYELIAKVDEVLDMYYDGKSIPNLSDVKSAIADVVQHDTREVLRREEEEAIKIIEAKEEALRLYREEQKNDVLRLFKERIEKMENGELRRKGGREYTRATIKAHRYALMRIERFVGGEVLRWEDIDSAFLNKLIGSLEDSETDGLMQASINSVIDIFRGFVYATYAEDIHDCNKAVKAFSGKRQVVKDAKKQIYLTAEEIQGLYDMELSGYKELVRDLFLAGVYTCQRISDYKALDRDCFGVTARGNSVVRLRQKKTGKEVVIPILNNNLLHIAERRGYDFKYKEGVELDSARFNVELKEICKMLAEKIPSLNDMYETNMALKQITGKNTTDYIEKNGKYYRPKYDMVSSHTARRTGITLLYLSGKFDTYQMMSVSGHTSETIFKNYIKLSLDEVADEIVGKMDGEELF